MKSAVAWTRRLLPVAKFLYENRKAEIALALSVVAIAREAVQIGTGH